MYDTCNWVITMAEKCEQYIHRCEFPHTSACGTQLSHARHINGLVIMGLPTNMGTLWTPILNQPVQWDYIDKRGIAQLVGGIFHVELFFFRLLPQVVIGLVAFGPWYCLTAAIYSFGFQGVGVDICYYCKNWYTPKIMHHFRLGPHIPLNPIAIASPRKSALSSPFVCWLHPHFHTNHPIKKPIENPSKSCLLVKPWRCRTH